MAISDYASGKLVTTAPIGQGVSRRPDRHDGTGGSGGHCRESAGTRGDSARILCSAGGRTWRADAIE
jgi:hypothetical protein